MIILNWQLLLGRSDNTDVLISSLKCSKKHCEIFFKDGKVYVLDYNVNILSLSITAFFIFSLSQSTSGTYVNEEKILPNTEREIFENDHISFGANPTEADRSDRTNFIYKLTTVQTFTVDSDDDSDILEITSIDPKPSTENEISEPIQIDRNVAIENNEVEAYESEADSNATEVNEEIGNNLQPLPVIEPDQPEADTNATEAPNDVENHPQPMLESFATTSSAASTKTTKIPILEKFPNLKKKQQLLRHWNQQGVKLIEPLEMKKLRKRRTSVVDSLSTASPAAASAPRKRGRPRKVIENIKNKLKELADNQPVKEPPKPKRKRDLKIKITKDNRGNFLVEDGPKLPKMKKTS